MGVIKLEEFLIKCLSSEDLRIIVPLEDQIYSLHFAKHKQQSWLVKSSHLDENTENKIISCLFDKLFADEHVRQIFNQLNIISQELEFQLN